MLDEDRLFLYADISLPHSPHPNPSPAENAPKLCDIKGGRSSVAFPCVPTTILHSQQMVYLQRVNATANSSLYLPRPSTGSGSFQMLNKCLHDQTEGGSSCGQGALAMQQQARVIIGTLTGLLSRATTGPALH